MRARSVAIIFPDTVFLGIDSREHFAVFMPSGLRVLVYSNFTYKDINNK